MAAVNPIHGVCKTLAVTQHCPAPMRKREVWYAGGGGLLPCGSSNGWLAGAHNNRLGCVAILPAQLVMAGLLSAFATHEICASMH